ncbi:hypothetical protein I3842_13G113200 [Carya illinoinensis]|uniref:BED-type domain-containing protein n=1 Tax=Carya illinoinensis TaxID=32201 RepID=A0A922AJR9_CARIL|nr:hypothetical protein I3842_13G113200 [Carya illinoinensis]
MGGGERMESSTNDVQESTQDMSPPPPPPQSNGSNRSVGGSQSGRVRSMIWDHFTKIPKGDSTKPRSACNYCGVSYAYDMKTNGTKSMKYHIEKQCKKCPFKKTDNSQMTLG